jgi:hypothetical protein
VKLVASTIFTLRYFFLCYDFLMKHTQKEVTMHVLNNILGGDTAVSKLINCHPSVVAMWKTRGNIPARRQWQLVCAAVENKIPLTSEDFFTIKD